MKNRYIIIIVCFLFIFLYFLPTDFSKLVKADEMIVYDAFGLPIARTNAPLEVIGLANLNGGTTDYFYGEVNKLSFFGMTRKKR